jgi:hydroxymethylpyrimidine pyrophosphatase-like HAD family hydrolase
MYRSAAPFVEQARITAPVICYQGAAVVDPDTQRFLVHRPLELDVARDAIAALLAAGHAPNVYVDDELYVGRHTDYTRRYGTFQQIPVTEVGDLLAWLDRAPTKLVAVDEPSELVRLRTRLEVELGDRVSLTRSLPHLLELGHPAVSKGTGLVFVTELLGMDVTAVLAFGDGENDRELLETAGYAVAIEGGDPVLVKLADATCLGPSDDGVADFVERMLLHLAA